MPSIFRRNDSLDYAIGGFPSLLLYGVEADMHHGIRSLVLTVPTAICLPHFGTFKKRGEITSIGVGLRRQLEESAHHCHVERFAKAARTAKKRHGVTRIKHIGNEHGFVDHNRFLHRRDKAVATDRKHLATRAVDNTGTRSNPDARRNGLECQRWWRAVFYRRHVLGLQVRRPLRSTYPGSIPHVLH